MLLGGLQVVRAALRMPAAGLHTSSVLLAAPRPKAVRTKLKSHSGAKKRFFPIIGSAKGSPASMKFTRGSANKQHLNSNMSRVRLNRLEGTKVVSRGPVAKMLRLLLSPSY